ncbi:ribose transport system ATP-binding protein [Actinomadura meyerae]|uniref:Ribose transport system ATP-binding protein n=1 Tax=Actinomadura meyerae TaxID=240840 RepID=A0A239NF81_9ACTN|nr:ATP-binding cassette domain-containing protein [Actinomadura meyerae]SNT53420.1 ribose transport system ATP-binding protein [Actinomadura meyerae]
MEPIKVSDAAASGVGAAEVLGLRGVSKSYPGVRALNDVSLSFRAGRVHGLVGENGAGKSTLMAIASGAVRADEGTVALGGEVGEHGDPNWARERGLAIVHQEPALLPDLTVAENMRMAVPARLRPSIRRQNAWAREHLAAWEAVARIAPDVPTRQLRPDERFVVEIARALACEPSVLILDEPTEHLLKAGVAVLFEAIRRCAADGVAVVYISHRIREVIEIADVVSVLRNGELRGTRPVGPELTEDELVTLIVGRRLSARFPAKLAASGDAAEIMTVRGLRGAGFDDVSFALRRGEILGLAGVEGQGQREVLRALAGLERSHGTVRLDGAEIDVRGPARAAASGVAYLSNDRHRESALTGLSVRENLMLRALAPLSRLGLLSGSAERRRSDRAIADFGIRTVGGEAPIESLSGGNQQKVMIGRVLLSDAALILVDEPSQGVDVGARAEIYALLREATAQGKAVCVLSSDNSELAGLCDRVLVFSRGRIVKEFDGDEVVERGITEAAVTTSTASRTQKDQAAGKGRGKALLPPNVLPWAVLGVAILALGAVAASQNEFYLSSRNFGLILPMLAIMVFASMGQQFALLVGGIDLSIGPLISVVVVTASFVLAPGTGPAGMVLGCLALLAVSIAVAVVNWGLVRLFQIGPIIATLVTYTALQGVALIMRETPGGSFEPGLVYQLQSTVAFIPVTVIVAIVVAVALELALTRTETGVRLRAAGSNPGVAAEVGVKVGRMNLLAYVGASVFAMVGALVFLPVAGSGNATVGNVYTLSTIGAVVLGGASLFGGRGSFVGALLGAAVILQINTVVSFLGLTAYWQQFLLGALVITATAFYSKLGFQGAGARSSS